MVSISSRLRTACVSDRGSAYNCKRSQSERQEQRTDAMSKAEAACLG